MTTGTFFIFSTSLYSKYLLGVWESYCHFWIAAVNDAAIDAAQAAHDILEVETNDRKVLSTKFSAPEIDQVLNLLYANPYVTLARLRTVLGMSLFVLVDCG